MLLARYTARRQEVSDIRDVLAACQNLPADSQNAIEDFVTACGDRYLSEKVYGAHVLISWRRDSSRVAVDELMGSMLGARTFGATLDPLTSLLALEAKGLGREEVFIEASGVPFEPREVTLPSGQAGFTVESAREYLEKLAQANVGWFAAVTDYSMARYEVSDVDSCLALTGRQSALPEAEWACVAGHITALSDVRDGAGDLAFLKDRYEVHKLALTEQASRLTFNTVPQSRCAVDADGDPDLERSGPCQEEALQNFVKFYEACTERSAQVLSECRDRVLPQTQSCAAFEASGCVLPTMRLSNGTVVTCDEAGVNAALADVVPYQVHPPFSPAPAPGTFQPPLVLQFSLPTRRARKIPSVSTATDLCGITGVSGGLHRSSATVEAWGPDWMVTLSPGSPDPDKQVSLEVTCVKGSNFHYLNGGSYAVTDSRATFMPDLNGSGHTESLLDPGNPMLGGWINYLDEPATTLYVTNPDSTGFGQFFGKDLFPFVSTEPILLAYTIQANAPRSGAQPGGSLMDPALGQPSNTSAYIELTNRSPSRMSVPLRPNSFCYLTGLSGRYFNSSDSARINTSDGFTTLAVTTPLTKDRNPGAIAQCVLFDQY
jgi:hypothetical protein